ncbi:MAG: hypothetical protein K2J12_05495 [Muribaculaceae bacterium]|nr:hypothetical protein [Muribaculaceae bacterium]
MKGGVLLCIVFATAAFTSLTVSGQRTTRSRLKSAPQSETVTAKADFDTVATAADSLLFTFSGYEKTLRSAKETFFVTNRSDSTVDRLEVAITYKDMKGRVLDRRQVGIDLEVPAGETRRADIRSWDRQNVFYYHLSPMPRSSHATPYRVSIVLVAGLRRR